ncbi:glycosyltransferase [Sphingomonas sp. LaA6.9]|nr:glycosyltransferase [Sphingomonas sp. LaA6.9]MCJ8158525.1 glycosyltransferase [Sphingomonas sp. LaA6.9]
MLIKSESGLSDMGDLATIAAWTGATAHELVLFAAVLFLIGGIDDLLVDLVWIANALWRRLIVYRRRPRADLTSLAPPRDPGWLAVFIPAWREDTVIAQLLSTALARFDHPDYRLYVGVYPNDPATIVAVASVAARDLRVRMVINARPGPTTKADCLNALWSALERDERKRGCRAKAIVLHDAEDVVHSGELRIFDTLIERFVLVQLPVLPLVDRGSRWISGHYCDEFAEAHGKSVVAREALGAAVPSAGVGCAFARERLNGLRSPTADFPSTATA